MKPYYEDAEITLYHGDCREVVPTLDRVDAVVTDPPYGLKFMGKDWDHGVPGVAYWKAIGVAMKPGAHLLAFGGTRTFHRLTCWIEDAGFEIRDCVMWVYGSGFPKSLDVSKAIDKARTEDRPRIREVCRFLRAGMDAQDLNSRALVHLFGDCDSRLIDHWAARDTDSQPSLPTREQFEGMKSALGLAETVDRLFDELDQRRGEPSDNWKGAEVVGSFGDQDPGGLGGKRFTCRDNLKRAPAIDAARQWDGWGTALKPAWEPIIIARKPLEGTVAENVLKYGTGALNIDATRAGSYEETAANRKYGPYKSERTWSTSKTGPQDSTGHKKGRWPANLILTYPEDSYKLRDDVTPDQLRDLAEWMDANAE